MIKKIRRKKNFHTIVFKMNKLYTSERNESSKPCRIDTMKNKMAAKQFEQTENLCKMAILTKKIRFNQYRLEACVALPIYFE